MTMALTAATRSAEGLVAAMGAGLGLRGPALAGLSAAGGLPATGPMPAGVAAGAVSSVANRPSSLPRRFWVSSLCAVSRLSCASIVSIRDSMSADVVEEGVTKLLDPGAGGAISGAKTRPAPSGKTLRWTARNSPSIRRKRASVVSCACAGWESIAPPAQTADASVPARITPRPPMIIPRLVCFRRSAAAPKIPIIPDPVLLFVADPALISIRARRHHGKP